MAVHPLSCAKAPKGRQEKLKAHRPSKGMTTAPYNILADNFHPSAQHYPLLSLVIHPPSSCILHCPPHQPAVSLSHRQLPPTPFRTHSHNEGSICKVLLQAKPTHTRVHTTLSKSVPVIFSEPKCPVRPSLGQRKMYSGA